MCGCGGDYGGCECDYGGLRQKQMMVLMSLGLSWLLLLRWRGHSGRSGRRKGLRLWRRLAGQAYRLTGRGRQPGSWRGMDGCWT